MFRTWRATWNSYLSVPFLFSRIPTTCHLHRVLGHHSSTSSQFQPLLESWVRLPEEGLKQTPNTSVPPTVGSVIGQAAGPSPRPSGLPID